MVFNKKSKSEQKTVDHHFKVEYAIGLRIPFCLFIFLGAFLFGV